MLHTNTEDSNRVVPSGSYIYAVKSGDRFLVLYVRLNSRAEQSGIKPGMELTYFNNQKIEKINFYYEGVLYLYDYNEQFKVQYLLTNI